MPKPTLEEIGFYKWTSKERVDSIAHPALLALRKERIGPLWPDISDHEHKIGMRGTPKRTTKHNKWDEYRLDRRKKKRDTR